MFPIHIVCMGASGNLKITYQTTWILLRADFAMVQNFLCIFMTCKRGLFGVDRSLGCIEETKNMFIIYQYNSGFMGSWS